jgi:hypothetical protein
MAIYIIIIHISEYFMQANVGNTDRIIRFGIAILLAVLYFTNVVTGTLGIILLVGAIVLALTAAFKFCGVYAILGMNSCEK